MESSAFTFSIPNHTLRVDGYMDAVGRTLSTDTQLYALCAQVVADDASIENILGVKWDRKTRVENWSKEFGSLVGDLLGMNQRDRLGFYLIDTIRWFKDFTSEAKCFQLECNRLSPDVINQAVYLLELEGSQRVLILAVRSAKTHNSLKSQVSKPSD
jgi:hypothetical protein